MAKQKLNIDGLSKNKKTIAPEFTNREWLESNDPKNFHTSENVSTKYSSEREEKTQSGLAQLADLELDGTKLNPLIILLGKWWEVKPARAAIKSMIDAEAADQNKDAVDYLQNEIGSQIEQFENVQSAIDRVRYAKTYFKPRESTSTRVKLIGVNIDGKLYQVPQKELAKAKSDFGDDRDALKNYLISVAVEAEVEEI